MNIFPLAWARLNQMRSKMERSGSAKQSPRWLESHVFKLKPEWQLLFEETAGIRSGPWQKLFIWTSNTRLSVSIRRPCSWLCFAFRWREILIAPYTCSIKWLYRKGIRWRKCISIYTHIFCAGPWTGNAVSDSGKSLLIFISAKSDKICRIIFFIQQHDISEQTSLKIKNQSLLKSNSVKLS